MATTMRLWSAEEDKALRNLHETLGPSWKIISKKIPGRTVAMCRNRFQRMNAPTRGAKSRNRCHFCGQLKRGHTCTKRAPALKIVVDEEDEEEMDLEAIAPLAEAVFRAPTPEPSWNIEAGVARVTALRSPLTAGFETRGFDSASAGVQPEAPTPAIAAEPSQAEICSMLEAEPTPQLPVPSALAAAPTMPLHQPAPLMAPSFMPPPLDPLPPMIEAPAMSPAPTPRTPATPPLSPPFAFSFPAVMRAPAATPPAGPSLPPDFPSPPLPSRSKSNLSLAISAHPMSEALRLRKESAADLAAWPQPSLLASRENSYSMSFFDLLVAEPPPSAGAA